MTRAMVDDVSTAVEEACIAGVEASLRDAGAIPEPRVHLFVDSLDQPYLGFVGTRPYRQGTDAAEAIATLGSAAAAATATRVVLVWEAADLQVSLTGPGDHSTAVACVTASIDGGHVLHWYPFQLRVDPPTPGDGDLVSVQVWWGQPMRMYDGGLPSVIHDVLREWRGTRPDYQDVFPLLSRQGYVIRFVDR